MILKTASLMPEATSIICHKRTEPAYQGVYDRYQEKGTYLCRQCGLALFRSAHKFKSDCGWPSFDNEVTNNVATLLDLDGMRREIICARCQNHLGHIFHGEQYTPKNTRYCVNSLSLDFVTDIQIADTEEAIFAAGCFWGVEYCFKRIDGVLKTEVGYTGGQKSYPTYQEVCGGKTGHMEAIRMIYDPPKTNYETLLRDFFKIHNPTQINGQGPDIGFQYSSAIFYYDDFQQHLAQEMLKTIAATSHKSIATQLLPVSVFWPAEDAHQNYYDQRGEVPYCHRLI